MSAWFPLAERLQDRGYMVLTFDFRGFGQSEPPRDASAMPTDVATGVEILTLYGADRIAVVGSGAGGTAAVGTDLPGTVLGVAALAAAPTFDDLDAREQAGKLEAKTLVLDPPEGGGAAIAEIVPDAQLERIDAGPTPESDERVTSLLERFIEQTIGKP